MCVSNSAEKAQQAQAAADAQRKADTSHTISAINSIYGSADRQQQYNDFLNAVRSQYGADAARQKTQADLQTKFATARSGLTGGSRAVDAQQLLNQEYQRGILQAEDKAQGALAGLKAQDNTSRLNLINLAQNGLDLTTASQQANAATQQALDQNLASSTANGLGDIFAATTAAYQNQQLAQQRRLGYLTPLGTNYGSNAFGMSAGSRP